ncbi:MAG: transcription elongation factor GreA, partial [Limnochordia bacterium]
MEEDVLTWDGVMEIERELEHLRVVARRRIAARIKDALGFGDAWENPEYLAAKHEQAFIEGRISTLEGVLRKAKIIRQESLRFDRVEIGSWVKLYDVEANEECCYRIVGS